MKSRIAEDCLAGRFSGLVIALQQGRTVLHHMCGHSNAEAKLPIDDGTRYKIFSMSKPFTGTAVMILAQRGRVDLDRSIRRYLPEVPEAWEPVTVRHLLNHLSGVPDLTNDLLDAYLKHGRTDHDQAIRLVLESASDKLALQTKLGDVWRYNNFGYELLASLIERVSGETSAAFIKRNIFARADMKTAGVELPLVEQGRVQRAQPSPGLAQGYNGEPGKLEPALSYSFVQQGAGALHMSYRDLLAFNSALARGAILAKATQARIQSEAHPIRAGTGYGLGWLVRNVEGKTYFQHSGGTNGFATDFARTPDGENVVIVLSNLGFASPEAYRKSIMDILLAPASSASAEPKRTPVQ